MRNKIITILAFVVFAVVGVFCCDSSANAISVNPDDIPNQSYVIGTYMFTRDKGAAYPGYITTKSIMLAAQTIEGADLDDMNIYYKTARGVWTDGITGQQIETPELFGIRDINMGSEPTDAMTPQVLQMIEGIRAWQKAHPELARPNPTEFANTYPWKNDCPQKNGTYTTYYDSKPLGGYVCKSVSYVAWKAYEVYGVAINWGNAYSWDDYGRMYYVVDHNPAPNTIGQTNNGTYGHVFWVESINQDGSINVTEYDNAYSTLIYSGVSRGGDFGARTMTASEAARFNYIHLE